MPQHLCVSAKFLDGRFHGRGDGGEPEWPPSPLRLFQALVAVAKAQQRKSGYGEALRWLEQLGAPAIVAPRSVRGKPVLFYVPQNDADSVAWAWSRGDDSAQLSSLRVPRPVRPQHICDGDTVHYLWPLSDEQLEHAAVVCDLAAGLVALGWGVDLVAGRGQLLSDDEARKLTGTRWRPAEGSKEALRVPVAGTLAALERRHAEFTGRLRDGRLHPVGPLTSFRKVGYSDAANFPARPFVAFELRTPDGRAFKSFEPRCTVIVAAMARHAAANAAAATGRPEDWIKEVVLGHEGDGPARGEPDRPRLAFVPLPTVAVYKRDGVQHEVVGRVRRLLIVGPPSGDELADWAGRFMAGGELVRERDKQVQSILAPLSKDDGQVQRYTGESSAWSTVTPVILPGFDDGRPEKAKYLLRKSITQAGFPQELADHARLEWRSVAFLAGLGLASHYLRPARPIQYPQCHVRLLWRDPGGQPLKVRGPVVLGSGRHHGLGLFATDSE